MQSMVTKHLFLFHIQILQRISQAVPLAQNSNEQTSSWESFSEISELLQSSNNDLMANIS